MKPTKTLYAHYVPPKASESPVVVLSMTPSPHHGVLRRVVVASKVDARIVAKANKAVACF